MSEALELLPSYSPLMEILQVRIPRPQVPLGPAPCVLEVADTEKHPSSLRCGSVNGDVRGYVPPRVQELCESRGGRPSEPYGFCGRKATLNHA